MKIYANQPPQPSPPTITATNDNQDKDAKLRRPHNVDECPRCGDDHGLQHFDRLARPIEFDGHRFEYWRPCNTNGEPIFADLPFDEPQEAA